MGKTISSANDMMTYAGDLRRAARQASAPELADKMQRSAQNLEQTALAQISDAGPLLGKLLDTFA